MELRLSIAFIFLMQQEAGSSAESEKGVDAGGLRT